MKIPSEINNKYEEFYHEDKRIKNLALYIRDILFDDLTIIKYKNRVYTEIANSTFPSNLIIRWDGNNHHYIELDNETRLQLPKEFEDFFYESVAYVVREKERLEKEKKEQIEKERKENFLNDITSFMYEKNLDPGLRIKHRIARSRIRDIR